MKWRKRQLLRKKKRKRRDTESALTVGVKENKPLNLDIKKSLFLYKNSNKLKKMLVKKRYNVYKKKQKSCFDTLGSRTPADNRLKRKESKIASKRNIKKK